MGHTLYANGMQCLANDLVGNLGETLLQKPRDLGIWVLAKVVNYYSSIVCGVFFFAWD